MTQNWGEWMNKIKEYRSLANMSQLELSKKVGVARQTINLIENQKYQGLLQYFWESLT